MDPTAVRHRRSASSADRLLRVFPSSPSPNATVGDELNEAELFWATDCSESENQRPVSLSADKNGPPNFSGSQNSGILSALTEPPYPAIDAPVFCRKPSVSSSSSSRTIPSIPRHPSQNPQDHFTQSLPARQFQQSAPVKVPILLSKDVARRRNVGDLAPLDDDVDEDGEMLPPHEMVARGSGVSPRTTFSVLEGVGRTLKGRDLRQVRNAIWRKTGFLD